MTKPCGRSIAISPFRSLVLDLMHFSQQVPAATVERKMDLAALVDARQNCSPRPMWTSIFAKAFGLVAMRQPVLRRSYMTIPWARYYEHPKSIATVNLCRSIGDEDVVLQAQVRGPENRSLAEIDAIVRYYTDTPVEEIASCRRVARVSCLPWPMRRLLMWTALNLFGRRRCHNFGTFGISSVAGYGAGILNMTPLLTTTLHHGLLDERGCIDMRLNFDHRVLDGAPAAQALALLEETLMGEILDEVQARTPAMIVPTPIRLAA